MIENRWQRWLRRHDRAALVTVALVLAGVLIAAFAPRAEAGRYTVAQCDRANRAYTDAAFERVNPGDYAFGFRCEEDESASSLQIHPLGGAPANRYGRISWAAPPSSKIIGVSGEARLRNDSGQQARLSFLDSRGDRGRPDRDRQRLAGRLRALLAAALRWRARPFRREPRLRRRGRVPEHRPGPDLDPLGAADDQRRRRPGRLPRWVADRAGMASRRRGSVRLQRRLRLRGPPARRQRQRRPRSPPPSRSPAR